MKKRKIYVPVFSEFKSYTYFIFGNDMILHLNILETFSIYLRMLSANLVEIGPTKFFVLSANPSQNTSKVD